METCVQKYSSDCSRLLELQYPYASRLPAIEALRHLPTHPHQELLVFFVAIEYWKGHLLHEHQDTFTSLITLTVSGAGSFFGHLDYPH